MPFKRKTLSELRQENRQFMQAELESVGALLRFGNLKVLADMDAGMAHLHYAYGLYCPSEHAFHLYR